MPKKSSSLDVEDVHPDARGAVTDVRRVNVKRYDLTTEATHRQHIRLREAATHKESIEEMMRYWESRGGGR